MVLTLLVLLSEVGELELEPFINLLSEVWIMLNTGKYSGLFNSQELVEAKRHVQSSKFINFNLLRNVLNELIKNGVKGVVFENSSAKKTYNLFAFVQ